MNKSSASDKSFVGLFLVAVFGENSLIMNSVDGGDSDDAVKLRFIEGLFTKQTKYKKNIQN